jgi:PQQ-dependent catabolism-associated CXXCW motif protein
MSARSAFALLAWAWISATAADAQAPPEPEAYRLENFRAPTPATLRGATVLTTAEAERAWRSGEAVFIDVLPRANRPAELAPGTLWRDPPHDSIPGAIWLPNTGYGELAPETEAYFRRGLAEASKGDPARRLVFFCLRACWMSWNAAKRALEAHYTDVMWFRDGTDGWQELGYPLVDVAKEP